MRTLQLELEYIYGCLEEEALDIGQGTQNPTFLLSRQVCPSTQSCDPKNTCSACPNRKKPSAQKLYSQAPGEGQRLIFLEVEQCCHHCN